MGLVKAIVGNSDGVVVGTIDGDGLGFAYVGITVGERDGIKDGILEGANVGSDVGS